jgi:X-X-X-Leu-X-X-Gly heptad repeat protein
MKKLLSVILSFVILLTSAAPLAQAAPASKEEVIYGILKHDGSVESLYVVNIFDGGDITDYGIYDKLTNLTGREALNRVDDKITISTEAERFYYQGDLALKELPWNIDIKYYMNDKEMPAEDLAGISGKLKITITISKNPKISGSFYDNFGLQIGVTLDNKLSNNIVAENATIAEAGGSKQINFTVLPGNPFEGIITADVKDFEMDAITINAIRLAFDIDIDSDKLTGQFTDLIQGVEALDEGAGDLLDGLNELSDGISDYMQGLEAFKNGIGQLSSGAGDLYGGASELSQGLLELTKQNNNINNGASALLNAAFDAINSQLQSMGLGLPVLTPDNYSMILSNIPDLATVKLQLDGIMQFAQGLKDYTDAVAQLGLGAEELTKGLGKFKDSSGEIVASANAIYDGAIKINSGIKELRNGLAAYKDGTNKFREKSSGIDIIIDDQINNLLDEITGQNDMVESFVSEKNTEVSSVQFVLKTKPIEMPDTGSTEITEPVKLNFWQKLLKLFGLYKG